MFRTGNEADMSETVSTDATEELRTEVVVAQINDSQRARYEQL